MEPTGRAGLADAQWLRAAYCEQGLSLHAIARRLGVAHASVREALLRHGVPLRGDRSVRNPRLEDGAWLRDAYEARGLSVAQVAAEAGSSDPSVLRALREHGIVTRRKGTRAGRPRAYRLLDSAAWLSEQYVEAGRSSKDIAAELGVSAPAVIAAVRRAGLPVRGPGRVAAPRAEAPVPDRAWLAEQVRLGRSAAGIAAGLGMNEAVLRRHLRAAGLSVERAPKPSFDRVWDAAQSVGTVDGAAGPGAALAAAVAAARRAGLSRAEVLRDAERLLRG